MILQPSTHANSKSVRCYQKLAFQLSFQIASPAVAPQRVLVLRLSIDAQLSCGLLAAVAHVKLVVDVGEAVVDEPVVELESAVGSLAPDLVFEITILDHFLLMFDLFQ